jgi:sodium-dependent dicarboxylate transporter 2/3/5
MFRPPTPRRRQQTKRLDQKDFIKIAIPWCLILLLICTVSVMLYRPLIGFV